MTYTYSTNTTLVAPNEIYINWDLAPYGTTHVFAIDSDKMKNGIPCAPEHWEQWNSEGEVLEWTGSDWKYYCLISDLLADDISARIKRPDIPKIDETWYVQLPQSSPLLTTAFIAHITEKTICLTYGGENHRYITSEIKFVERVK